MTTRRTSSLAKRLRHHLWTLLGAAALTFAFFMVLPLIQAINQTPIADLVITRVDTANVPPPPPPPEEEPEKEPEPEEQPPELVEEAQPLDLAQLEMALNPSVGDGWMTGDFSTRLNPTTGSEDDFDAVFSMADLDQAPRVVHQPGPVLTRALRKQAPATVYIVFLVNQRGGVENPIVQKSSNPVFDKVALAAVRQWKFDPGKRNGKAVRFRMRVPITFPKGE